MERQYCSKCGTEISNKSVCPNCGKSNEATFSIAKIGARGILCLLVIGVIALCTTNPEDSSNIFSSGFESVSHINDEQQIIGVWKGIENTDDEIEFAPDGVLIWEDINGTWSLHDGRLSLTLLWGATSCDYELSGSTLKMIDDNGDYTLYKKQ